MVVVEAEAEVSILITGEAETAIGPESPVVVGEEEATAEEAVLDEDITMGITSREFMAGMARGGWRYDNKS